MNNIIEILFIYISISTLYQDDLNSAQSHYMLTLYSMMDGYFDEIRFRYLEQRSPWQLHHTNPEKYVMYNFIDVGNF